MKKANIFVVLALTILYMVTFHNLDLLANYAVINNQQNSMNPGHNDLLQIRDCNLFGCQDYRTIYIYSMTFQMIAIILLAIIGIKAILNAP